MHRQQKQPGKATFKRFFTVTKMSRSKLASHIVSGYKQVKAPMLSPC